MRQRRLLISTFVAVGLSAAAATAASAAPTAEEVLASYADIAHAGYGDSLITAESCSTAVEALIAKPTDETLAAAREAWLAARAALPCRPRSSASATPSSTTGRAG